MSLTFYADGVLWMTTDGDDKPVSRVVPYDGPFDSTFTMSEGSTKTELTKPSKPTKTAT